MRQLGVLYLVLILPKNDYESVARYLYDYRNNGHNYLYCGCKSWRIIMNDFTLNIVAAIVFITMLAVGLFYHPKKKQ